MKYSRKNALKISVQRCEEGFGRKSIFQIDIQSQWLRFKINAKALIVGNITCMRIARHQYKKLCT